jgi:pimeloyl-ACP methyl ester carboxylesterase/DNA-binding winged helix-turn-helix (wHTH) protein
MIVTGSGRRLWALRKGRVRQDGNRGAPSRLVLPYLIATFTLNPLPAPLALPFQQGCVTTPTPDGLIFSFGEYELDTRLHELRRGGKRLRVEPQVFDVLAHLFARRDRAVSKVELLEAVWGHRYVAPTTLNSRIKAARQAVGDDGVSQRIIRTIHGVGFRVVADVAEQSAVARSAALPTSPPVARTLQQEIRFCTASDGIRIAYATSGAGAPIVKPANWLTHLEFDWESPVWRHWLRELSSDHTLIRHDQRGSGLSDRDAPDLSFEAWVRDLEAVVDASGLERFPLFGLSQGCAVAITYAARHPERVTRLVLYGGYAQGPIARARTPDERQAAAAVMQQLPLGWGQDNPAFRLFFAARFLPGGSPEQMRWFSELQRMATTPEIAVRLLSTIAMIDITAVAPRVRAPTLVLHASGDAVTPFDQGRQIAALVPGARFVLLESPNHILLEGEPAWTRFTDEVRRFLAEDADEHQPLARSAPTTALSSQPPPPPPR